MSTKQFKDPIYGYVEIDSEIVANIIDTPVFQRLKDIRQTSYTPLYPAAYHNRYVHSIGVYHLGCIAFRAIKSQLKSEIESTKIDYQIDEIQALFELSCLLHDVGHAPFSHTGETFFLDEEETLYNKLKEIVNDEQFSTDFDALGAKKPAPHECMSCVVGLNAFQTYFEKTGHRSFFARCIIGMPFRLIGKAPENAVGMSEEQRKEIKIKRDSYKTEKQKTELLNCIISLLNSSIIDVDRLDYIIRDAETIGFKNVQVDYMRLLNGLRIVTFGKKFCIGYHKSALSVIESAVYAHDAEKKWVQGHPSILYEMEALKNAMSTLTSKFSTKSDTNPLFCYESLTEAGKRLSISTSLLSAEGNALLKKDELWSSSARALLSEGSLFSEELLVDADHLKIARHYPISLLADEDILHLMKWFCKDGLGHEYFARNRRRSAVWKSEAEFRALFQERIGDASKNIRVLENEEIDEDFYNDIIAGINSKCHWTNILIELARDLDLETEFLIIFQKKFNSSFKAAIGEIPILFPSLKDNVVPLKNVVDVLKASADRKSNFFHLFYRSKNFVDESRKRVIVNTLAERLIKETNYR